MSEWRECRLGDVADITSSKRIFYSEYVSEGIPFYRSKEIIDLYNKRNISTELFISEDKYNEVKSNHGVPDCGDILLTSVGSLGIPYKVSTKDKFYFKDGNLTWFRKINSKVVDVDYLMLWLDSSIGKQKLDEITIGSTQPALTISGLKTIDIMLPPLSEQKAIASVLSSLDDKIDLLHRQNKTLEAMAETLFRQWFVEEADDGWEEKPLSYFSDIICGKTPSKSKSEYFNGNIPFIKIPDMHGKVFVFETEDSLTEAGKESQNNKILPEKSILVSCIATVGLVVMNAFESQSNQQINTIIPKHDYYRYYLYLQMKSLYDELHAMASGGTATLNLNTGNFSIINMFLPPEQKLKKFNSIVSPFFDKIYSKQVQIRSLEKLRDTLLPKLMSGEVRVIVDNNSKI